MQYTNNAKPTAEIQRKTPARLMERSEVTKLREFRRRHRLSLADLALVLRTPRRTVESWLYRKRVPGVVDALLDCLELLGVRRAEQVKLPEDSYMRVLALLENPPAPNAKLVAAAKLRTERGQN